MKAVLARRIALCLAAMLGCAPALAWPAGSPGAPRGDVPAATTPTLVVRTLAGTPFKLAAQRGKWVVINYWATWCSPCIQEMPALSAFVSARHNVVAIGLAYEDQPVGVLRAFLRKHPVRYPVARIDPAHPPAGIAMPEVLPTTFLIAPDGHLARTFIGPLDLHELAAAIGTKRSAQP